MNCSLRNKSVPDSGYASEEDFDNEDVEMSADLDFTNGSYDATDNDALRADPFERTFAIKWLAGFISRSDVWISSSSDQNDEDERYEIMDDITSLLSAFAGEDLADQGLTRRFAFPLANADTNGDQEVNVELNDAPISNKDHTSVGLQSWASSSILAERMCTTPVEFGLGCAHEPRILELGAGTGLLSIVAAKLRGIIIPNSNPEVVATDFHPDVLSNLLSNIQTNCPSSTDSLIEVRSLDWQHPLYTFPLDSPFDIIFAADVIYHPDHAKWIKGCVERLLRRPHPQLLSGTEGGVFWLIIALRSTGRHEGLSDTVSEVFPDALALRAQGLSRKKGCGDGGAVGEWELAVLESEQVSKQQGLGRADESGYKLFKIGWVRG